MKKKLIICIPALRLGGAAKIALNLCEYFSEDGTEVTVMLTGRKETEKVFSDVPEGVTLIAFPNPFSNRILNFINKIYWIASQFRRIKPDAILSVRHDATVPSSIAWKLGMRPGKFFIREINPITFTLKRNPAMVRMLKKAYASADGIIANSKDVMLSLAEKRWVSPERLFAIDNPVLTKSFYAKAAEVVPDPWLEDQEIPVIITIGRLQKMKAHETLIKAFKIVKNRVNCRLLIIGEGEEYAHLQELIDKLELTASVRLTGGMVNPYPYLKAAEVFVLTSLYEGFGNVLVEALSLGKKVVATNCVGGPAYILNYGEYGTLVTVGAVEEIAEAIINKLAESVDKDILIKRAMEFSVDVVGKKYGKVMFANHQSV
jgi:glycosyltransferase involved in cell wall biosynthesis